MSQALWSLIGTQLNTWSWYLRTKKFCIVIMPFLTVVGQQVWLQMAEGMVRLEPSYKAPFMSLFCNISRKWVTKLLYVALTLNNAREVSPADSCCSFDSLQALLKSCLALGQCVRSQYIKRTRTLYCQGETGWCWLGHPPSMHVCFAQELLNLLNIGIPSWG